MLDAPVEELYFQQAVIHRKDHPEVALTYKDVSQWSILNLCHEVFARETFETHSNPITTGAHYAHVEVDTWTGLTKVLDYLALHDVGQAINPAMCIAQTQGAVQMGCGAALREQYTFSPDGRGVNSLSKYHLMNAPDLPEIQVELIQDGPVPGRSLRGQVHRRNRHVPVAAAVSSAVNRALGTDMGVLPMDPDRILECIARREA